MLLRPSAAAVKLQVEAALAHKIPSALTVTERPAPEMLPTGIAEIDQATGGIARGTVTEICGAASSGRTSVLLSIMAGVTRRGEAVALLDASDAFHPESGQVAGIELKRLLWVRCAENRAIGPSGDRLIKKPGCSGEWWAVSGEKKLLTRKERLRPVEQALKATDLLLQSGGFGLIVVDLGDVRPEDARRVPLTTWFRFRRAIENTPTTLVIVEQEPYAKTCASLVMTLRGQGSGDRGQYTAELRNWFSISQSGMECANPVFPTHSHLFHGMKIEVEISRGQLIGKKPVQSVPTFESRTELAIC
jgi:hypothetical protein